MQFHLVIRQKIHCYQREKLAERRAFSYVPPFAISSGVQTNSFCYLSQCFVSLENSVFRFESGFLVPFSIFLRQSN